MDKIIKEFKKTNKLLWMLNYLISSVQVFLETFVLIWIVNKILNDIMKNSLSDKKIMIFICVFLVCIIFRFSCQVISFYLQKKLTILLEDAILTNVLESKLEIAVDEVLITIQNSVANYSNQYINYMINISMTSVTIITIVIYTSLISVKAVIICMGISAIVLILTQLVNSKLSGASKESEKSFNDTYMEIWEYLMCCRILPFCNDEVYQELSDRIDTTTKSQIKFSKLMNVSRICERFSNIGIILIISLIYGIKSISGQFNIVDLFSIIILLPSLSDAIFKIPSLQANYKKINGIKSIISNSLVIAKKFNPDHKKQLYKLEAIKALNLNYEYENGHGCKVDEFIAKCGEVVGIYGESGSGKSTFLKCIMGLVEGYKGSILINNEDILSEINVKSLWENALYISQEPVILPVNIHENIALDEEVNIDFVRMKDVFDLADLLEMFNEYEDVNRKIVSSTNISTGEMQKMCIARCFYLKKKMYVLDEATNAMSPQAESKIISNLIKKVKEENSILILVTHNMNLIKKCDRVYEIR